MAKTYQLPGFLGGHECEIVPSLRWGTDEVDVRVMVDGARVEIRLPREHLVEVEPELPPEPPVWSVVLVKDAAYQHLSELGMRDGWYLVGNMGRIDWSDVCADGTPVLLVPDPAAGAGAEFKWIDAGNHDEVKTWPDDGKVYLEVDAGYDAVGMIHLPPSVAERLAASLLAAARAGA